jgi:ABC-type branched-subunit amino acid transport system substrate-binding protein
VTHARAAVAVLATVLVVGAAACDSGGSARTARSTTTTTSRPAVDGALGLGELAPLTGPVSAIATSFTQPVQLAVDEMNLAGGVNKKPVALTVGDDASSVDVARATFADQVDTHHVDAVIGPSS